MVSDLQKSLEIDMFYGGKKGFAEHKLKSFLGKLGIKSARDKVPFGTLMGGAPLQIESLSAVLKEATFDMKDLTLWPKPTPFLKPKP